VSGVADMFGGMSVKSKSSPRAPAHNDVDLLGSSEAETVEAVLQPTSVSGLFGDVNIKTSSNGASAVVQTDSKPESHEVSGISTGSSSGFSFISAGVASSEDTSVNGAKALRKASYDPLLSLGMPSEDIPHQTPKQPMGTNAQIMAAYQQTQQTQQQQMIMMHMQKMQMAGGSSAIPQMLMNPVGGFNMPPARQMTVMGGSSTSGVTRSFAFMEDPVKAVKEASNKKFDFVQDAINGAKK